MSIGMHVLVRLQSCFFSVDGFNMSSKHVLANFTVSYHSIITLPIAVNTEWRPKIQTEFKNVPSLSFL